MKKCLFLLLALLLLSFLFGLQRCTICLHDSSVENRHRVVVPVQEDTLPKEEEQAFMDLETFELENLEETEVGMDSSGEGTDFDISLQPCPVEYPLITIENLYVVQPVQMTSFKAFQKARDYEIEHSMNISGIRSPDYVFLGDILFRTRLLTKGDCILLENPTLDILPIGQQGKSIVETAFRQQTVDFMGEHVVEDMSQFDRRDAHFTRFTKDYGTSISFEGQQTVHSFTLDFPDEDVPYREDICRWLSRLVSDSYFGDPDQIASTTYQTSRAHHPERWYYRSTPITAASLGQFSANRYFEFKKMQYPGQNDAFSYLIAVRDWRLCLRNDRFLTYQQYTFDYDGGAHGDFSSSLRSYDFVHQEEMDCRYLFRADALDSVKSLLLDEASRNEMFVRKEQVETVGRLYYCFAHSAGCTKADVIAKMQLPTPGLSEEGVVFSYAPYEIGAFASGVFHIVIPYGRLLPYLTPRAKWCLNLH